MNKVMYAVNNRTKEGARLVPLVARRYDSRFSKVTPKLRPKSRFPEEGKQTFPIKIRTIIGLGIFTAWFVYIGIDLLKIGYSYVTDYQTNQIKQEYLTEEIVEFRLPFGKKSKQKEIDSDNEF